MMLSVNWTPMIKLQVGKLMQKQFSKNVYFVRIDKSILVGQIYQLDFELILEVLRDYLCLWMVYICVDHNELTNFTCAWSTYCGSVVTVAVTVAVCCTCIVAVTSFFPSCSLTVDTFKMFIYLVRNCIDKSILDCQMYQIDLELIL